MSEGASKRDAGGRGRLVALSLGAVSLAVVVWGAWNGWHTFRVRVHEQRIRHGVNPQGNLDAIALITHPAAVRALERYALDPPPGLRRDQALRRLCENFPDSRFPRGTREWESITERSYVGFWAHELDPDRRSAAGSARDLRGWLEAYPAHPGRDDAHLRLAVQLMEETPVEALRLLHDGFHEGPRCPTSGTGARRTSPAHGSRSATGMDDSGPASGAKASVARMIRSSAVPFARGRRKTADRESVGRS